MTSHIYVRIRGRTIGPITPDQARGMVMRGQLSRLHEVSLDGAQWQSAADFPELFKPGTPTTDENQPQRDESEQAEPSREETQPPSDPIRVPRTDGDTQSTGWYYAQDNQAIGPIDKSQLVQYLGEGALPPETQVWHESLSQWQPASSVPALIAPPRPMAPLVPQPNDRQPRPGASNMVFCRQCGAQIHATAAICPSCGSPVGPGVFPVRPQGQHTPKSRLAYILLALFLGLLGVHNFYAGYVGRGLAQLFLLLFGIGVVINPFWVIIEMIIITKDADGVPFT